MNEEHKYKKEVGQILDSGDNHNFNKNFNI